MATTATYEARALGVHSGMGLMKAAALAPDAILLPADFEAYARCSRLFKAAVAEIAPAIEDRGIDEIFIDLTDVPGETVDLARRIKAAVRRGHWADLLHRRHPQQAAVQDRFGTAEAGRPDRAHPGRRGHPHLAPAPFGHQRRRPQGQRRL